MQELGRGAQYKVFDTGNGRVRKIALSKDEMRTVMRGWGDPQPNPAQLENDITDLADRRHASLDLVRHARIPPVLLGNPKLLQNDDYEQDKLTPLLHVFENADATEQKAYIDHSLAFMQTLWAYGVAELTHNFTSAHGLNAQGELVLLDFGEITTDQAQALRDIEHQTWRQRHSYLHHLSPGMQQYLDTRASQSLTVKQLKISWQTANRAK